MLENLTILAIIIIAVWVLTIAYYFRISRQHKEIRKELDALQALLEEDERPRE